MDPRRHILYCRGHGSFQAGTRISSPDLRRRTRTRRPGAGHGTHRRSHPGPSPCSRSTPTPSSPPKCGRRRRRRWGLGAGGAAAGQLPGDDTGGFAAALLSAAQLTALLAIPEATLRALLDAAGVPHAPAHAGSDLRIKCAAAAWAGEKLRSTIDLRALDNGTQARMLDAFEVPMEARRATSSGGHRPSRMPRLGLGP